MKTIDPLTRHQILLYKGDFDRLNEIYRRRKATEVVRLLVRQHLDQIDAKQKEKQSA